MNDVGSWEDDLVAELGRLREQLDVQSGEMRIDPEDGNGYVLRSAGYEPADWDFVQRPQVTVNDIMGGHTRTVFLSEWVRWSVQS